MPFRPELPLLRVEVAALHTIDTTNVEALFGMHSLFSKTSHVMQDGKRLENLSWRLWNRETFCCAPQPHSRQASVALPTRRSALAKSKAATAGEVPMPALSSSLDSTSSSDDDLELSSPTTPRNYSAQPSAPRNDTPTENVTGRGREKHLTPIVLEKIVVAITETSALEPIDLPIATPATTARESPSTDDSQVLSTLDLTSSQTSRGTAPQASESQATLPESSTSTIGTQESNVSPSSQSSQESSSTEMSTHSIVRGFVPGGAPSSYRSQTNLASQPTPILKTSPTYRPQPKKKVPMFQIGTSSGEDEGSFDIHMHGSRSTLSDNLKAPGSQNSNGSQKHASFNEEVSVAKAAPLRHSAVFESDDEEEDVSESAIEDDDDSSDWEDSDDASGPSSVNEKDLFQRVDSRPNLTSRCSLLTTLMHEPDRAKALANAASRSTPAIRRSRTTTPNGPSVATSPEIGAQFPMHAGQDIPRSKPIIMTTSNTHQQLALSPRTTRRNMLSTELTESLRKNLLWERQHKSTGNLAALKRRHTSNDVKNLKQHPEPGPVLSHQGPKGRFTNDYFHAGLGEYHAKGW
ncbi:unnamed protein product [Cercospora beticola]|nr:unnamed protein product [Cercospora beticola]